MSHGLLYRISRSVPLSSLKQGSKLSLRSRIPQTNVRLEPKWRDDGHVALQQTIAIEQQHNNGIGRMTIESSRSSSPREELSILLRPHGEQEQEACLSSKENVVLDDGSMEIPPLAEDVDDEDAVKWSTSSSSCSDGNSTGELLRCFEYRDGIATVTGEELDPNNSNDKQQSSSSSSSVTIVTPEKIDLDCELLSGGSITVSSKVEGDVRLVTNNGNIRVKKLRGHKLELETRSGVVFASDLLEAQGLNVVVSGESGSSRMRAKKIHGHTVNIRCVVPPEDTQNEDAEDATRQRSQPLPLRMDDDDEGSVVDVGSIYIAGNGGAQIRVESSESSSSSSNGGAAAATIPNRAVRIKSSHGPVQVETVGLSKPTGINEQQSQHYPLVEFNSVNGSCEVSIKQQQNKRNTTTTNNNNDGDWTSCQVHFESMSPDSVSLLTSEIGNVTMSLDRKVQADLRFLSLSSSLSPSSSSSFESNNGLSLLETYGELLAEDEDEEEEESSSGLPPQQLLDLWRNHNNHDDNSSTTPTNDDNNNNNKIMIDTKSFTCTKQYDSYDDGNDSKQHSRLEYVEGYAENKSEEPDSRFEVKTKNTKAESPTTLSAAQGKIRLDGAANQALSHFSSSQQNPQSPDDENGEIRRGLVVVVSTGQISLETLSWIGAIAKRYGLDESKRDGDLGRTASRRGRPLVVPLE